MTSPTLYKGKQWLLMDIPAITNIYWCWCKAICWCAVFNIFVVMHLYGKNIVGVCLGRKAAQTLTHTAPQALPYIDPTKISPANAAPIAGWLVCSQVRTHKPMYQKYMIYYTIVPRTIVAHKIYTPTVSLGIFSGWSLIRWRPWLVLSLLRSLL